MQNLTLIDFGYKQQQTFCILRLSIARLQSDTRAGMQVLGDRLTDAHNAGLNLTLINFAQEHPEASVMLFDFYTLEQGIRNNATMYNITDLENPCWNGRVAGKTLTPISTSPTVCSNPDKRAFWDAVHPTAFVHNLWGEALAKQLQPFISSGIGNNSVPLNFPFEADLLQPNQLRLFQ